MKKLLFFIAAVAIVCCVAMFEMLHTRSTENTRLKNNQAALLAEVDTYRTAAGQYAASCTALELTNQELRDGCADLSQEIEALGIKLKRAEAASKTATQTRVELKTVVRDSIIYRDTALVHAQTLSWSDPWTNVNGLLLGDALHLSVSSQDTLLQVVHRVPYKFWFIKWGTKYLRQDVRSSNPHTAVTYTEYIDVKK